MVSRKGEFIIQRHNELRDLEADLLNTVCHDAQVEPVLQEITGEVLTRGTNPASDARLEVNDRGFWDRQSYAFFGVRVFHPNIQTQSLTKISPFSRFIANMKMRRRGFTRKGLGS